MSDLAALLVLFWYNCTAAQIIHRPQAKTTAAAILLKFNSPVKPVTGKIEIKVSHTLYKMACKAVLVSFLPDGNIEKPAFL